MFQIPSGSNGSQHNELQTRRGLAQQKQKSLRFFCDHRKIGTRWRKTFQCTYQQNFDQQWNLYLQSVNGFFQVGKHFSGEGGRTFGRTGDGNLWSARWGFWMIILRCFESWELSLTHFLLLELFQRLSSFNICQTSDFPMCNWL